MPTNHVSGVGDAAVRLNGTLATVSVNTKGLLNKVHAMHIHAGGIGECPPGSGRASARRTSRHQHDRRRSLVRPAGHRSHDVEATPAQNSIIDFKRYKTGSNLHYTRPIRVSKVVAAEIRTNNAVVVVHGIDYNRNGIYDNAALDRSDLATRLPGEKTAPALCGQLVAQKPSGSGATKTARAPSVRGTQVFTASLNVQRQRLA